jgi:hypothetical protein
MTPILTSSPSPREGSGKLHFTESAAPSHLARASRVANWLLHSSTASRSFHFHWRQFQGDDGQGMQHEPRFDVSMDASKQHKTLFFQWPGALNQNL